MDWIFTLFGFRLFSVSDRNYHRVNNFFGGMTVTVSLVILTALIVGGPRLVDWFTQQPTTVSAAAPAATTATTDPRAGDVEPERLLVESFNSRFANGHLRVRSPFGTAKAQFAWFCNSDACRWQAVIEDAWQLRLADGPYLLTAYDEAGTTVATWRCDRTGRDEVELVNIYLLRNQTEFRPMLRIEGVGERFEPLGREVYLVEPLG